MPGFNQTGPMGQGPMTGRKMGRCTRNGVNPNNQSDAENSSQNSNQPENMAGRGWRFSWKRGFGFGGGSGGGRGMGRQNRFRGGN